MSDKFFPSRKLGQNFLNDRNMLNKIADYAELTPEDRLIEIGPGFGSLTEVLCSRNCYVTAIEKDKRLFQHLLDKFSGVKNLRIVHGDVLKTGLRSFSEDGMVKVVSNLPYSISSQILFLFIGAQDIIDSAVIMLQKEVAERICSGPSSKTYGSLTVMIQTYFNVKRVLKVPPEVFKPRPRVDSSVIRLVPHDELPVEIPDQDIYRRVVRASFSSRRKIIKNSLSTEFPGDTVSAALSRAGIDENKRAEVLGISEFARLANEFYLLQQSTSSVSRSF